MMMIVGHFGMVWLGTLVHGNKEIEVAIKKIRGIGKICLPEKNVFIEFISLFITSFFGHLPRYL